MGKLNLIYGRHVVEEFLTKHPTMVKKIWIRDEAIFYQWQKMVQGQIPLILIKNSKFVVDLIGEEVNHQGFVAEIKEYNYYPFNQLAAELKTRQKDLILILDQIHDPYNFGAIIRSASLLGVKNILILDHRQALISAAVVKTSAGSVYDVQISKVTNLTNAIKELKKWGYWVYASNLKQDALDMRQVNFASKTVLVIGNEEKGVSDLVTKNSDQNILIPSTKLIDSFNASVATALILYEVANQLKII